MRRDDLVHTPAGWAVVDRVELDADGCEMVVVTVELPDGTDDPRPRKFRREEVELAWWEHVGHA
jgi:hypothetical protein